MIFDSDILIWRLRNHSAAVAAVAPVPLPERNVSAISYLELLHGCRNRDEFRLLKVSLTQHFSGIIPVSGEITKSAVRLMECYALSRRPEPSDVLIAATALVRNEELLTGNRKHFEFIPGLALRVFQP